jgi:hypothetical protein
LFQVHFSPEALARLSELRPRTRGSLERQIQGMAKVIGLRELLTDSERYGSVRSGRVEARYEVDSRARTLRVYEIRRAR